MADPQRRHACHAGQKLRCVGSYLSPNGLAFCEEGQVWLPQHHAGRYFVLRGKADASPEPMLMAGVCFWLACCCNLEGGKPTSLPVRVLFSHVTDRSHDLGTMAQVSLALMDRVLGVDAERRQVTVQAGARVQEVRCRSK